MSTTDKSWIRLRNRNSPAFKNGLRSFIEIAKNHVNSEGKACCPCRDCANSRWVDISTIYDHVFTRGFLEAYDIWHHHGEKLPNHDKINARLARRTRPTTTNNEMFDVIDDVMAEQITNDESLNEDGTCLDSEYDELFKELNSELYPGCDWMSSLNFLAKMMHIKVINKWSDSSFDQTLELLKFSFPKENRIPASHYEAKKKLRKIGLGYQSIHVCINDCALFWKENESMQKCPVCNESRWKDNNTKGKKVPNKVLRYFPLTSRLRRRYGSRLTAKDMIWHNLGRSSDGVMRHPVDGKAWQDFDKRYPDFAKEPRNVRLGLAADGFNPFGNISLSYSMWPVVLTTYNTPPWLCMKESSFMMTLLIPGPKSPGKDIDVFLRPLVDELKMLWADGVQMRDASTETVFKMRAALLWTINDYPARSSLSGWSGQGYKACPTCNKDTPSCRVTSGYENVEGAKKCPPEDFGQRRWADLIEKLFMDPKYKKQCTSNKRNRAKVPYPSYHGSVSYSHMRWKEQQTGDGTCSFIEGFKKTHFKEDKWANETALADYEKVRDEGDRMQNELGDSYDEVDLFERVLGKKRGHIKGVGQAIGKRPLLVESTIPAPSQHKKWQEDLKAELTKQHEQQMEEVRNKLNEEWNAKFQALQKLVELQVQTGSGSGSQSQSGYDNEDVAEDDDEC